MRRVLILLVCAFLWVHAADAAEDVKGKTFYTTANMWYENDKIESTNYHKGLILLIGTKVTITEVKDDNRPVMDGNLGQNMLEQCIRFSDEKGKVYTIIYISRHAVPGTTIWDYLKQYFSENNPMAEGGAFTSLTPQEQLSVKEGVITNGMSKKAVIMAYGYPPGHKTPSLEQDKWIYWLSRFTSRAVYFNNNMVIPDPRGPRRRSTIDLCIKACKENTSRTSEQCFDDCKRE